MQGGDWRQFRNGLFDLFICIIHPGIARKILGFRNKYIRVKKARPVQRVQTTGGDGSLVHFKPSKVCLVPRVEDVRYDIIFCKL